VRRILFWVLLVVLLLGGGFFVWSHDLRVDYLERLAALEAAGEPVRFADLAPPEVPDDENGAPLLEEARAWYERFEPDGEPACLFEEREDWTDEDWAAAAEYVRACEEPYVKLLEAAVARPHCRFDLDWEQGPDLALPMIPGVQAAARVLTVRALLAAGEDGGVERAGRSLVLLTEVADRLPGHSLICHLVRMTLYRQAAETLREIAIHHGVARLPIDPPVAGRLAAIEDLGAMRDALRGERVLGIWVVDRWLAGDRGDEPLYRARTAWFHRPLVYLDGLRLLDFHEKTLALVDEPYHEARSRWTALTAESNGLGFPYLATRMTVPILGRYAREVHLIVAQTRLARVALALAGYFRREGRWPAALSDLGTVPPDPGTGGAFAYEHLEDGVRIAAALAPWDKPPDELPDLEWRLRTP
jgi:hypothetical protein